jgi:hypothetical protein
MTIAPNLSCPDLNEDLSLGIDDLAPEVHLMASRFLHSQAAADELARQTIARAKYDLLPEQTREEIRLHFFKVMREIVISYLSSGTCET